MQRRPLVILLQALTAVTLGCGSAAPPPDHAKAAAGVSSPGGAATSSSTAKPPRTPVRRNPAVTSARPERTAVARNWALRVESPQPAPSADPALAPLERRCGTADAALRATAEHAARIALSTGRALTSDELSFHLRAHGVPYVRPRTWLVRGSVPAARLEGRLASWVDGLEFEAERRCGLARVESEADSVTAALVVDVLADARAVPTRVELAGTQELTFVLRAPATAARLVALGPDGPPELLPNTLHGNALSARFRPEVPGRWVVQAVLDVPGGPRVAAEAWLFAGTAPPREFSYPRAPGEEQLRSPAAAEHGLLAASNDARRRHGLAPLQFDRRLTSLARRHAQQMLINRDVAHDVGAGGPERRAEEAGLDARAVGENVARAASVLEAYRLLWASPSHRGNLLHQHYDGAGIGVAEGDGEVWVCQLFAEGLAKSP